MSTGPPLTQAVVAALFRTLSIQIQMSFLRWLALLIYIGMHTVLSYVIGFVVPRDWLRGKQLLEGVFFLSFGLVYLFQVVEMVGIFVPRLRILQARVLGEHNP